MARRRYPPGSYPRSQTQHEQSHDLGALEQRVYGLERSIDELGRKIDARNTTQWPAVSALLVFIGMAGAVLYLPINQAQNTADTNIEKANEANEKTAATLASVNASLLAQINDLPVKFVPRTELTAELEARRQADENRWTRVEQDIRLLNEHTFPREVHQERWSAFGSQLTNIQQNFTAELGHVRDSLESQGDKIDAISPAGNVLQNLVDRIERLESRWIDRRMTEGGQESLP